MNLTLHSFQCFLENDSFPRKLTCFLVFGCNLENAIENIFYFCLESTDAAPEVQHPRLRWLSARRSASAFFFFFSDSRRLGSICADVARFVLNRLRFVPNRADSAKIGPY